TRMNADWAGFARICPRQIRANPRSSASYSGGIMPAMPELPDIEVYLHCMQPRVVGQALQKVRLVSPFLLRSVEPPRAEREGKTVRSLRRLGKRIVSALDGALFLALHLMIAGRLPWKPAGAKPPGRIGLAAFDFPAGTLMLTEAGTKRRASLHLVQG